MFNDEVKLTLLIPKHIDHMSLAQELRVKHSEITKADLRVVDTLGKTNAVEANVKFNVKDADQANKMIAFIHLIVPIIICKKILLSAVSYHQENGQDAGRQSPESEFDLNSKDLILENIKRVLKGYGHIDQHINVGDYLSDRMLKYHVCGDGTLLELAMRSGYLDVTHAMLDLVKVKKLCSSNKSRSEYYLIAANMHIKPGDNRNRLVQKMADGGIIDLAHNNNANIAAKKYEKVLVSVVSDFQAKGKYTSREYYEKGLGLADRLSGREEGQRAKELKECLRKDREFHSHSKAVMSECLNEINNINSQDRQRLQAVANRMLEMMSANMESIKTTVLELTIRSGYADIAKSMVDLLTSNGLWHINKDSSVRYPRAVYRHIKSKADRNKIIQSMVDGGVMRLSDRLWFLMRGEFRLAFMLKSKTRAYLSNIPQRLKRWIANKWAVTCVGKKALDSNKLAGLGKSGPSGLHGSAKQARSLEQTHEGLVR